jgi:hypothetical protein
MNLENDFQIAQSASSGLVGMALEKPKPPVAREKLRDLDAIPAKDILRNKARVCPPITAICEILDNIFDNYEESGWSKDLAISIVVKGEGDGEISIAENSGGIRENKLEPLVRLGVPYHSARGSIGTWGEGFKVAAFSRKGRARRVCSVCQT